MVVLAAGGAGGESLVRARLVELLLLLVGIRVRLMVGLAGIIQTQAVIHKWGTLMHGSLVIEVIVVVRWRCILPIFRYRSRGRDR